MRSTVIVAAYNEGDLLLRTLRSAVSAGNGLEYELLIADDGSTDGSVEAAVQEFPQVRVVRNEKRRGASGCKALGADHAKGDVLIFLDGHTNPEAGSLEALVQNIEDLDGKSIVTPRVATLDPNTWINDHGQSGYGYAINLDHMGCWWIGLKEMKKVKAAGRVMYESPALIGCAMGISKALYTKLHGFDRDMLTWGVEDLDFGLKCWLMGGRILHNPEIVIGHRFRKTFTNFKVPIEHLVANQMRMARKNYTESIWQAWIKMTRQRYEKNLWKRCREVYEEYQESAEQERSYLMGNRQYDELWYVQRFGGRWPRLEIRGRKKSKTQSKTLEALGSDAPPTPSASPSHGPSAGPSPSPKPAKYCPFETGDNPDHEQIVDEIKRTSVLEVLRSRRRIPAYLVDGTLTAGNVESVSPGATGFDTDEIISHDHARELHRQGKYGYSFCVRYVPHAGEDGTGDISKREAQEILTACLGLMLVQHARGTQGSQWIVAPNTSAATTLGTDDGTKALNATAAAGVPTGVTIFLDLEEIASSVSHDIIIAYCSAWRTIVGAFHYAPGLYIGDNARLSSAELTALGFAAYWKSGRGGAMPAQLDMCQYLPYNGYSEWGLTIDLDIASPTAINLNCWTCNTVAPAPQPGKPAFPVSCPRT